MAQKKAHEVEAWLARPDPRAAIVLLYGPDRGLVSERAARFARASGVPLDDPFSVVKIDAGAGDDGGAVLGEARMVSMFSTRRLIWVRNAGAQRSLLADLAELGESPPADAVVLVEAGDLKKGAPLRAWAEGCAHAVALPCYGDEGRTLDGLIDEEMKRSGLTLASDARQALRSMLGGDRLASRGELEKLALFARGSSEVTLDDVRAVAGDVSAASADDMVDRVLAGDRGGFAALYARHVTASAQVHPVLAVALRQFQVLHATRARMDAARQGAAAAVAGMRPPPFGPRKALLEQALGRWSAADLQERLSRLHAAVLETRRRPELAVAAAEKALLATAANGSGESRTP